MCQLWLVRRAHEGKVSTNKETSKETDIDEERTRLVIVRGTEA